MIKPVLCILGLMLSSSCSLLFGTVKPVAQKSSDYRYQDLHLINSDWTRIPNSNLKDPNDSIPGETEASASEASLSEGLDVVDISYQSKKTGSTIALTSTCRPRYSFATANLNGPSLGKDDLMFPELTDYMQQLLLGITSISEKADEQTTISGLPAIQSTLVGKMQDRPIKIRAIVTKKNACLFDIVFITRPRHFSDQEKEFTQFVNSIVIP